MPLSCAYVHLCSTQGCATYLPGKCSLSGRVSTTKFTKTQGGRGSQACANAFSSTMPKGHVLDVCCKGPGHMPFSTYLACLQVESSKNTQQGSTLIQKCCTHTPFTC